MLKDCGSKGSKLKKTKEFKDKPKTTLQKNFKFRRLRFLQDCSKMFPTENLIVSITKQLKNSKVINRVKARIPKNVTNHQINEQRLIENKQFNSKTVSTPQI